MTVEHCSQLKTLPGCSNDLKAQQNIILWLQRHFVNWYRHCELWSFGRESTEEATIKIILTAHSLYGTTIVPAFLNHCSIITNQNCNSSENADIEGLCYSYYCICKYVSCLLRSPFLWEYRAIRTQKNVKQSKKEMKRISVKLDFLVSFCSFYHWDDKTLSLAVYAKS